LTLREDLLHGLLFLQKKRSDNSATDTFGTARSTIGTGNGSLAFLHVLVLGGLYVLDSLNGTLAVGALWALGLFGDNLRNELASRSSDGLNTVGFRVVWLTAVAYKACVSHGALIN
jgi:hypothetical protein